MKKFEIKDLNICSKDNHPNCQINTDIFMMYFKSHKQLEDFIKYEFDENIDVIVYSTLEKIEDNMKDRKFNQINLNIGRDLKVKDSSSVISIDSDATSINNKKGENNIKKFFKWLISII